MRKFATACVSVLVFAWAGGPDIRAQDGSETSGSLPFYLDESCFKMFDRPESTYVQLHFYVPRRELHFVQGDSFFTAEYTVTVEVRDSGRTRLLTHREWSTRIDDRITAADTAADVPLLFESNFLLPPGLYDVAAEIADRADSMRRGSKRRLIDVPDLGGTDLVMSDVQMATQIRKEGKPNELFYKNGYTVIPNPSRLFGTNLPRLFLYAEVYNLSYAEGAGGNYTVDYSVTDESGAPVKEYPSKSYNKVGPSAVILHSLNLISLPSGRYHLNVRVTDQESQKQAQRKKMILVYREGESTMEMQAEGESVFARLDEASLQRAENIVSTIGRDDERKMLRDLKEPDEKKKFFDGFWKLRDPSPGTKANEALIEYYTRYEQANQKFSSVNRPGWKSDMGRVFIVYGPPAQIEKHEFEANMLPYQIWYYLQLEGQPAQTVFVFADTDGTNIYRLIHSNARGEYTNPQWEDQLKQMK